MSKVKITGHASGSGTLTLTGPNTNSDRTLTLPDNTGTLLTTEGAVVINESGADVDFRVESDDNANMLFVNAGDDHVHIGSATSDSAETFQVLRSAGAATIGIHTNRASANSSALVFSHNRNTSVGSFTVLNDNDKIGRITWLACDGSDIATEAAQIHAEVDGTPGANDMPTALVFSNTADGAFNRTERLRITQDGRGVSQFTAKAWCKFTGVSTTAILDSHNVSSVTDIGTGSTRVNWDVDLANANYAVGTNSPKPSGQASSTNSNHWNVGESEASRILYETNRADGTTKKDLPENSIVVFGD